MLSKNISELILVFVLVTVALAAAQVEAQSITGTISGTLMDQTGAVVPGAEVVLNNERTSLLLHRQD